MYIDENGIFLNNCRRCNALTVCLQVSNLASSRSSTTPPSLARRCFHHTTRICQHLIETHVPLDYTYHHFGLSETFAGWREFVISCVDSVAYFTLQASDLWKMDPSREAGIMSAKLDEAWAKRVAQAKNWNTRLASGEIKPSAVKRSQWLVNAAMGRSSYKEQEAKWINSDGKRHASLTWALNDVLGVAFWAGGEFDLDQSDVYWRR